jgi:Cache domain
LPILVLLLLNPLINSAAFSQTTDSSNFVQLSSNLTSGENNNVIPKTNGSQSSLIVKLLSNNLEKYFQNAGAVLNMTSQLPQVRNVSFAHLLNETLTTLHGIPEDADIEKRQIAQNILHDYNHYQIIIFIMPNGDIYFDEPYSRQQISTTTNLGFRDYFEGVIRTNNTYLGDPSTSASSGQIQSVIAVPVYSSEDNSTLIGVWAGGLDFDTLNEELQSLNLTSLEGNARVVYVGHNGQKIADSDKTRASQVESFANLNSFKNAIINGQSDTMMDTVDDQMILVTYQPVKAFQNTFVVLLMQANNTSGN